jgi:arginyl-tRNA synthetase
VRLAGNPELAAARVALCRATLQTLTNALNLLGIEAPERM